MTNRIGLIVTVGVLLGAAASSRVAATDEPRALNGATLVQWCEAKRPAMDATMCRLYLVAFMRGALIANDLCQAHRRNEGLDMPMVCRSRDGYNDEQLAIIVVDFLKKHPEYLNRTGMGLDGGVYSAFEPAFSCAAPKPLAPVPPPR